MWSVINSRLGHPKKWFDVIKLIDNNVIVVKPRAVNDYFNSHFVKITAKLNVPKVNIHTTYNYEIC